MHHTAGYLACVAWKFFEVSKRRRFLHAQAEPQSLSCEASFAFLIAWLF